LDFYLCVLRLIAGTISHWGGGKRKRGGKKEGEKKGGSPGGRERGGRNKPGSPSRGLIFPLPDVSKPHLVKRGGKGGKKGKRRGTLTGERKKKKKEKGGLNFDPLLGAVRNSGYIWKTG